MTYEFEFSSKDLKRTITKALELFNPSKIIIVESKSLPFGKNLSVELEKNKRITDMKYQQLKGAIIFGKTKTIPFSKKYFSLELLEYYYQLKLFSNILYELLVKNFVNKNWNDEKLEFIIRNNIYPYLRQLYKNLSADELKMLLEDVKIEKTKDVKYEQQSFVIDNNNSLKERR